ncbi:MAG: NADH:flavin oxidoreductase/NADH oxidase [Dehalococcoidia bacterium]|nr:NADH:flavin oxidoreductase/NADH oxidase [Dehalococcoidia bacterium]
MPLLFQPYALRGLTLRNRIAVSPMCQYACEARDGLATPWHLVHLGARAVAGAGLVIVEASAVAPEGRITPQDLGIWSDAHADALVPIVDFMHQHGAAAGIQLAHAGRKASTNRPWEGRGALDDAHSGWTPVAPSALAYPTYRDPHGLAPTEISAIVEAFAAATRRAHRAGFDFIELHAAHGYLLHQFHSPLSNQRTDGYGGSFENRVRFTLECVAAVRAAWPAEKPISVRLSCTDWVPGGWDIEDTVRLALLLREAGVDIIDASSGGSSPDQKIALSPGYHAPFAERIRRDVAMPVAVVGLITQPEHAEQILQARQADLILLGRELLRNPAFPQQAATALSVPDAAYWPDQYLRAK